MTIKTILTIAGGIFVFVFATLFVVLLQRQEPNPFPSRGDTGAAITSASCYTACFQATGNGSGCRTACDKAPACFDRCVRDGKQARACIIPCTDGTYPPADQPQTCANNSDCQGVICPQVIGNDQPQCNQSTKTCYCGGTCSDNDKNCAAAASEKCQGNPNAPAKCFSCLKDTPADQLNILDFACFAKYYAQNVGA